MGGEGRYFVDGGGADASAGDVDDAAGGDVVGRIEDELQIRHHVADLGAVEKARAAHDFVGDSGAQEHVLQHAALHVRAVENGHVIVGNALAIQPLRLRGDPAALVALIACLVGVDELARAGGREQFLLATAGIVHHDGVCCVQNVAGRAVVLLQLNDGGFRVVLLEIEDVLDVGAAPGKSTGRRRLPP